MSDFVTFDILREIVFDLTEAMQVNAEFLTGLDRAIGDGDHGRNMAAGFGHVRQELLDLPPATPGLLLRSTGMTLVATVGGASGPLYGAAFIAAGMAVGSKSLLDLADLAKMTRAGADALARRGRCRPGDKTILDALAPAAEALAGAAAENRSLLYGLEAASLAAKAGMEAATPLVARRGLAMQYGTASAGRQDPGATSCYLIFSTALRTAQRICHG
ncbi:MAG: dihydroxyacetone kinase subunit DhaL [Chloroflexota bacterium]|nr:dihydroxyacetone kinase subunit DhaL [Chloroflexota bacterium]